MAGSSTNWANWPPRKPLAACFAASDIYRFTPVKLVEPTSASTSPGFSVQMCGSSNDVPFGVAYNDAAAGKPVTVYDIAEAPRVNAGGSVQPGVYVGVTAASEAKHPISEVTNKYPVFGKVAGASGTPTWAVGVALEAANPNETFTFYVQPRQLSSSTNAVGVLG
jgi:hypothetical protein